MMKTFLTKTFVTGILLVVPVFFLVFTLMKAFHAVRGVMGPIVDTLEIERFAGILLLNVLAVVALILTIFVLGLFAYIPAVKKKVDQLDLFLRDRVPGYSIIKGIVSGTLKADTSVNDLKTVLVRQGDTARIGFEVERIDARNVMVFLPNVPNPQTGVAAAFRPENVHPIDLPPHKVLEMLNFFGRGVGTWVGQIQDQNEFKDKPAPDPNDPL